MFVSFFQIPIGKFFEFFAKIIFTYRSLHCWQIFFGNEQDSWRFFLILCFSNNMQGYFKNLTAFFILPRSHKNFQWWQFLDEISAFKHFWQILTPTFYLYLYSLKWRSWQKFDKNCTEDRQLNFFALYGIRCSS